MPPQTIAPPPANDTTVLCDAACGSLDCPGEGTICQHGDAQNSFAGHVFANPTVFPAAYVDADGVGFAGAPIQLDVALQTNSWAISTASTSAAGQCVCEGGTLQQEFIFHSYPGSYGQPVPTNNPPYWNGPANTNIALDSAHAGPDMAYVLFPDFNADRSGNPLPGTRPGSEPGAVCTSPYDCLSGSCDHAAWAAANPQYADGDLTTGYCARSAIYAPCDLTRGNADCADPSTTCQSVGDATQGYGTFCEPGGAPAGGY